MLHRECQLRTISILDQIWMIQIRSDDSVANQGDPTRISGARPRRSFIGIKFIVIVMLC